MKRNILFLLSLCMLLLTCSDGNDPIKEIEKPKEENPFITLKKSNIDFTNEGGSEAILIESNVTWTAKSSASWCTVTPSSGNKSTTSITLTAPSNEDYDNRSCTVTLEGEGLTKTITVNQGENLGLLITQDRYELGNEESTIKVEVKDNVEFEVEINDKWITKIETRGLTTSEMEFKIAKNESYSNREGTITISQTDGDLSSTITVYQSQENAIILSEKEVEISDRSKTLKVVLKTNVDFDVTIQEDGKNWVSYTPTRGLREETVSLNITANNSDKVRSTEVYIKDKLTSLQETLTITQIGKEPGVYYVEKMGTLGSILNQTQKDTITTMIVKGEINKADFDVMKYNMPQLKYIDLKEVKCEGDKIPPEAFGSSIYEYNMVINTIILPESITAIGESAFSGCTGLTGNLILPDGLTKIESRAFSSCSGFTGDLVISDGITTIEAAAFRSCSGFTGNLILPDGVTAIESDAFANCTGFTGNLIIPGGVTTIGSEAFRGCSGITGDLIIPDGIKTIGDMAFYGCTGFTGDLVLPDGLTKIEGRAFQSCSGFTGNLIIPNGVTTIGSGAFQSCSGFTGDLVLPDGLTEIGEWAFDKCSGLTGDLILPDNLSEIKEKAFYDCSGFTGNLIIPGGVTTIGSEAFRGCSGITGDLVISDGITSIGYKVFFGCSNFKGNLILPNGVTTIEGRAFSGCSGFTGTLTLPDELLTIEENAFSNCFGLTGLVIGKNVTTIYGSAFEGCRNITNNVVFPASLTSTRNKSFYGCDKVEAFQFPHTSPLGYYTDMLPSGATVIVPTEAVATYKATNGWKDYNIVGY